MPVHCGDCGTLTLIEEGFRVCTYCRTRTQLQKKTARPRRSFDAIARCYECSVPIASDKTYCPRHEDDE
jgi:hypothetical protein